MRTKVGSFQVEHGILYASDPCYDWKPEEAGVPGHNLKARSGTWDAWTTMAEGRIESLEVRHHGVGNIPPAITDHLPWTLHPGVLGVDSGQMGFYDVEVFKREMKERYEEACNLTLQADQAGILQEYGVVSSSGYGDGTYTMEVVLDATGTCIAARVIFIIDEELEEDPDFAEQDDES